MADVYTACVQYMFKFRPVSNFMVLHALTLAACSYALFHYILADGLHHFIKCKKVVIHLELSENLISTTHATTHNSISGSSVALFPGSPHYAGRAWEQG